MKKLKIKFTPEAAKLLKKFHPESKKLIKIPPDTSTWGCLNLFTIHPTALLVPSLSKGCPQGQRY
jgi:hypothetical protein